MCSHDSGMTLLGKGCWRWGFLSILLVVATPTPSTCHPVNSTQSEDTNLYEDIVTYDDNITFGDTFTYDDYQFFTQPPEGQDAIQLQTEPTVVYRESTLQDNVTNDDTPTKMLSFVENENTAPLEARNRALEVNVTTSEPSGNEMPEETKMKDVLGLFEVDFLNPHDPAFEHPGALRMVTHTGDHLQVTKENNGSISVNGSLVDGVMSLPDGTEIYTLEKFLEQHQDQMDIAFKILAAQSKSLGQRSGRNFVTTKTEESVRLEDIPQIDESTLVEPEKPTVLPLPESQVTEIDSLMTTDATNGNANTVGNEHDEFVSNTERIILELLPDDNQLHLATNDHESTEPQTDHSALEFTESVTSREDIVSTVPKLVLTNDTEISTEVIFGSALFAFPTHNSTRGYVEELTPVTEYFTEANIDYDEIAITEPLQREIVDGNLDPVTEHSLEGDMDTQTLPGDVPIIEPSTEENLNGQAAQYNENSLRVELHSDHTPVSVQVTEVPPLTDLVTIQTTLENIAEAIPEHFTTAKMITETLHFLENSTELGLNAVHSSLNRILVDSDDFNAVTELGPMVTEAIYESLENPNTIIEEPVTELGFDAVPDDIPRTEISVMSSVGFIIGADIPHVHTQIIASENSSNDVSDKENWTFLPEPASHDASKNSPHGKLKPEKDQLKLLKIHTSKYKHFKL